MLVCAALALPSSAHGAAWAGAAQNVSPAGSNASTLAVAIDPSKDVFLAWSQGAVVYAAARPAGGSFDPSEFFATCAGQICIAAGDPDIAADADGNSIAVWAQGEIRAAMRPAGGGFAPLASPSSGASGTTPRIAFTPDGTAIAIWNQSQDVYAAVRPPGGAFGAPASIYDAPSGQSTSSLQLVTSGSGHAMAAFVTRQAEGGTQTATLRTILYSPAGWDSAETAMEATYPTSDSSCSRQLDLGADIAIDASGDAVAAAVENKSAFGPFPDCLPELSSRTLASRRPEVGGAWTPPQQLDTSSLGGLGGPTVAFGSTGEAVAAWRGASTLRYASAAPSPASPFAAAEDVPDSANAAAPDLAPLADGATMLAFERFGGSNQDIAYSIRPAGGDFGPSDVASGSTVQTSGLRTAADPAGDVAAAWLREDGAGNDRLQWLAYDASPPAMGQVNVPATGQPGQELAMSASATDAFSPFSLVWTFGDGAGASGPQVSHAYASPGNFNAQVTAVDAAGNSAAPAARTVDISQLDRRAPSFLGPISLDNRTLAAAARGGSVVPAQRRRRRRAPIGTRVTFRLDEAAQVAFTVARSQPGRRVGRRCVKPTRRNRKRRRCTRFVRQRGGFTVAGAQGQTRFRFTGRLRNRKLRPGRYRLIAVARDVAGNRSAPKQAAFRIVRR